MLCWVMRSLQVEVGATTWALRYRCGMHRNHFEQFQSNGSWYSLRVQGIAHDNPPNIDNQGDDVMRDKHALMTLAWLRL